MNALPLIAFENLPPELARLLAPRVERLGYLGEFFQACAHQPEPLAHFVRFTESLKNALPDNLMELCALTVATWSGNAYERVQHERLSLKLGLGEAWIRDIERLDPDAATGLSDTERAAQRLVLAVARTCGREATSERAAVLDKTDPATVIGILMATGRYLAHAAICNTLAIAAPVPSPLGERT